MGGTGANHIMLGYGSVIVCYADANGNPTTPPTGQIENPNPRPNTNNYYVRGQLRQPPPLPAAART